MERQRGIKALSIVALLVAVVGLTVAFAAMSRTLTINGTATVDPANWDIHFENLSAADVDGSAEEVTAPTINTNDTVISAYSVKLTRPGDSVTYTFDVVNEGDIPASLSSFVKNAPTITGTGAKATEDAAIVEENLIYTLTYADGSQINEGDELAATTGKASLKLVIAYDSEADELPAEDVTISAMDVTMIYTQSDN